MQSQYLRRLRMELSKRITNKSRLHQVMNTIQQAVSDDMPKEPSELWASPENRAELELVFSLDDLHEFFRRASLAFACAFVVMLLCSFFCHSFLYI